MPQFPFPGIPQSPGQGQIQRPRVASPPPPPSLQQSRGTFGQPVGNLMQMLQSNRQQPQQPQLPGGDGLLQTLIRRMLETGNGGGV